MAFRHLTKYISHYPYQKFKEKIWSRFRENPDYLIYLNCTYCTQYCVKTTKKFKKMHMTLMKELTLDNKFYLKEKSLSSILSHRGGLVHVLTGGCREGSQVFLSPFFSSSCFSFHVMYVLFTPFSSALAFSVC